MNRMSFPFAAIVGLPQVKLALMLGAVDWRLSVLLRGDKGAGKTTAARGIAELLPNAPFVNLPLGATEDRLLGGLDLSRTMKGDPVLKPGLLAQSHGGVVYIDEVNLLPDHLADSLLDVSSGGVMFLEREGLSDSRECRFLLLGSMNPEEGELRPQLLDRFALVVDVHAPDDPRERRRVVEQRLRFEDNPQTFLAEWASEQERLRTAAISARENIADVICPPDILDWISQTVCQHNVRSLRADLATVRASVAKAALDGARTVSKEHVQAVLPLIIAHRSRHAPQTPPSGFSAGNQPREREAADPSTGDTTGERIFPTRAVEMPRVVVSHNSIQSPRGRDATKDGKTGPVVSVRRNADPAELDPRASIARALIETGQPVPRQDDLHDRIREPHSATRYLVVVDSSGSHGVKDRMRLVKGAVAGLLEASPDRRDEVAVVAFRGTSAELISEPTRSLEAVRQTLEYLPTGGRTPLAHGLELALRYVTPNTILVLLTDGRANVPSQSHDAWTDALLAARQVRCPALVIDTETRIGATGRAVELAEAMGARHTRLDDIGANRDFVLILQTLR
jgi:magnesium chelatase subunit D